MITNTMPAQAQLPMYLRLKQTLVGTPFEKPAHGLRWLFGSHQRRRHPELWELYLSEKQLPFVLKRLLKPDSNCVDVGAHIGSFLSLLSKLAPNGSHVAFEPSKTKSAWLKQRFPNVEVVAKAVGETSGAGTYFEDLDRPGFSRMLPNGADQRGTQQVDVTRLDEILSDRRVDFIKLDIEGGEFAALQGARATIRSSKPAIIFECWPEHDLKKAGVERRTIFDLLNSELDYDIFCFTDFLFAKGRLEFDEFRKCGLYPYRSFNFVALPKGDPRSTGTAEQQRDLDYRGNR